MADVGADRLNLGAGIGRTHGAPYPAHNLHIGDVVAHIHNLIVGKTVLREELIIGGYLDGTAEIDILHTKTLVAHADAIDLGSREDSDAEAQLDGQLYGVAILNINGAKGHAIGTEINSLGTQHAIDIEDDSPNL